VLLLASRYLFLIDSVSDLIFLIDHLNLLSPQGEGGLPDNKNISFDRIRDTFSPGSISALARTNSGVVRKQFRSASLYVKQNYPRAYN
jgi:hypothetical protein